MSVMPELNFIPAGGKPQGLTESNQSFGALGKPEPNFQEALKPSSESVFGMKKKRSTVYPK